MDQRDGRVGIAPLNSGDGVEIQRQVQKPWAGVSKHCGRLVQEAFGFCDIAGRQGAARHTDQRIADAPRHRCGLEPVETLSQEDIGLVGVAARLLDMSKQELRVDHDGCFTYLTRDRQGTGGRHAGLLEIAPRMRHHSRPREHARLSRGRKIRQTQDLLVPAKTFGSPPTN